MTASVDVHVVAFHSRPQLLIATVQAALAQPETRLVRVFVNGDPEGLDLAELASRAAALGLPATRVLLSGTSGNEGFAGAHNRLLAESFSGGADAVLVLNPDLELEVGCLAQLAGAVAAESADCLAGPLLLRADVESLAPDGAIDSAGIVWTADARHLDALQGRPLVDAPTATTAVAGLTGACLFVPRGAWRRLVAATGEFFDPEFIAYREDAELGLRAAAVGITMLLVPAARGRHVRALRGTSRSLDPWVNLLGVRNRFLILAKHGRHRPGRGVRPYVRDLIVLAAAATVERSSWPGVVQAWGLRAEMHRKRTLLYGGATHRAESEQEQHG